MEANNFAFLNGHVRIGPHPHHTLLRNLADELGIDARKLPGLHWMQGAAMPTGLEDYVARGHINPLHHVEIWETNTDPTQVRDHVEREFKGYQATASIEWVADA